MKKFCSVFTATGGRSEHTIHHLCLLRDIFPSYFLIKILYSFLISNMRATCPPVSPSLIILIIFCQQWTPHIIKLANKPSCFSKSPMGNTQLSFRLIADDKRLRALTSRAKYRVIQNYNTVLMFVGKSFGV
jgi:hypothetical protein